MVRTTLPDELRSYVEESFEEMNPTVDVVFTDADADASLEELREGPNTVPFDVWWGAPSVALERAADAGLLQAYRPRWLAQPGVGQPSAEGYWQVVLVTPFVIAFSREDLQLNRAPTDWIDLFHLRWTDEIEMLDPFRNADGSDFMSSMIVQSLRDYDDLDGGFDWLARLDGQVSEYVAAPEEAVRALGSGEARLAILPRADVERARSEDAPWLYYRLPESGTPILALGVGVVAGSAVVDAAHAFVEHLGRMDVATMSKLHTRWQPGHGDVDMDAFPNDFEIDQPWTPYALTVDTLAAEGDAWVDRWEAEVRGRG
jgi:iron(III) transport system substrate-binding protein